MSERPCRYCGQGVTSENPYVDYCEVCFYTGRSQEEGWVLDLINDLQKIPGVEAAGVWHSGGGCFHVGVNLAGGHERHLLADDANSGIPASADGPWLLGYYTHEDDQGTFSSEDFEATLTRAELLEAVREKADWREGASTRLGYRAVETPGDET